MKKVLVVEDDIVQKLLIISSYPSNEYEVLVYNKDNIYEQVESFQPSLVIIDPNNNSINTTKFVKYLKDKKIKMISLSRASKEYLKDNYINMNYYISKPFKTEFLYEISNEFTDFIM